MSGRGIFKMTGLLFVFVFVLHAQGVRGGLRFLPTEVRGSCVNKIAEVWIGDMSPDVWLTCLLVKMFPGFVPMTLNECYVQKHTRMDLCEIPSSGPVVRSMINGAVNTRPYVIGISADQSRMAGNTHRNPMIRRDCDELRGTYSANPAENEEIMCQLYWAPKDGRDSTAIDSLVLADRNTCLARISTMRVIMTQLNCARAGGQWEGNPGAHDLTPCSLDICAPPAVDCDPSDGWEDIHACGNPSSAKVSCSYEMTVGIERGRSSEHTEGGNTEVTLGVEVTAEIADMFSASISTSLTTGFNWSNSRSTHDMWSTTTKRSITVDLAPGQSVSIKQVIGTCGVYRINTTQYRAIDMD